KFLVPAQGEKEEVNDVPEQAEDFSQAPQDAADDVRGPGNARIELRPADDEAIEPVLAINHLVIDAIDGADVRGNLAGLLRKMAKLVGKNGLEFRQIDCVDKPEADAQAAARWNEQVEEGTRVFRRVGIDAEIDVYVLWLIGADVVANFVDEVE